MKGSLLSFSLDAMNSLARKLKQIFVLIAIVLFCISCSTIPSISDNPWKALQLPTEASFADIAFTDDLSHGWLVGNRATLFESRDGGESWEERNLDLGEEKVSFNSVSFFGQEGWITGEPAILLHTKDGGETWSRIPLSAKLPGTPYNVVALGPDSAEMVTNLGAIYETTNGGKNWQALVQGAVGVARNIARSNDGRYIAVSARGNFYSLWEPGDDEWTPHQRNSSRRLQNMGFGKDGRLWLLARGGQLQFSSLEDEEIWDETEYPEIAASWGLLDMGYRTPEEIWVAGGSGNLLRSTDGGETWEKDRDVEGIPSNFYKVLFLNSEQGFVLGQRGTLLKYEQSQEPT